ncbi:RNA-binding domain-containing protein [Microbacterium sp. Nx66]|uniref:RNA-binding domain-containing protein n=1 Tax=Microbacterium sp. Nx66 TaxID=2766784 RepID=UPI0018D8296F|nr:RNA-binding domain-containing protein [Microbacterium sp. Nx66]
MNEADWEAQMGLQEVRSRFFGYFPAAESLDSSLRTASNPNPMFFMASVAKEIDLKGSGLALLRLGEDLERRFGINGEVAAYFTPWRDFQRRSFNAMTLRTSDLIRSLQDQIMQSERFTPSRRVALLISTDPNVQTKLDEWQSDSYSELTIVAIDPLRHTGPDLVAEITKNLRDRLGERDLYRTQNPVSGVDFFGRAGLMRNLSAAIDGDQNIAILGLRRSGKTSVLRELRRVLLPRRVVMPIADFQMLEEHSAEELASSIAASLNEELKVVKAKGIDVWIGNESDQSVEDLTPSALSDRIKRVASRNPGVRIVVAVDEVESAAAIARENPMAIKVLLGALRSAAQARENVSLVFSGVANRMFRSSSLGDRGEVDNPMFNQVSSVYLTPFELEETTSLLRDLGRPMLLDWQPDAIAEVQRLTGGFPYFVRDLASAVRKSVRAEVIEDSADAVKINADHVSVSAPEWAMVAGEAWNGIVSALGIHYPSAASLLDSSITEAELNEWIAGDAEAEQAAEDLVALKLLQRDAKGILYSPTLAALQSLSRPSMRSADPVGGVDRASTVDELVRQGESHHLEFKETSRINLRSGAKDTAIESAVVKTVAAFLNSDGGELLIGVADDGSAKGLDPDLVLFKDSVDRFERWIRGDLLAKRIDQHLVTDHVATEFVRFRGKLILKVSVSRGATPAWVDDKTLYRRQGNQTIELVSGRDVQQFLAQRS